MNPSAIFIVIFAAFYSFLYIGSAVATAIRFSGRDGKWEGDIGGPLIFVGVLLGIASAVNHFA